MSLIPGTRITVHEEALIKGLAISEGIIGAIGTAAKGSKLSPIILSSYAEAEQKLGAQSPDLTLVKALELAFANGAQSVIAVRVGACVAASITLQGGYPAVDVLTLTAVSEGVWGNSLEAEVRNAFKTDVFTAEALQTEFTLTHEADQIGYTPTATVSGVSTAVTVVGDVATFGEAPGEGAIVVINYEYNAERRLIITYGSAVENFNELDTLDNIVSTVNHSVNGSKYVVASKSAGATELPNVSAAENLTEGADGEGATNSDYIAGLTELQKPTYNSVDIVMLAGQASRALHAALASHLTTMAGNDVERVGVVGSSLGEPIVDIQARTEVLSSDRVIIVAPGIEMANKLDGETIVRSGAYAAAAVAGLIAGRKSHISITNAALSGISDVETDYNYSELEQLLASRICVLRKHVGIRITKGVTSSANTAWEQITVRRIVDRAMKQVRSAANPFIGKLNNTRVREALKGAIDAVLTNMLKEESLTDFDSNVYASREDEIAGITRVDLNLKTVFSIDYVQVTIYLK